MPDFWLLSLGAIFLLSSVAALTSSKARRDAVLERLHIHRRRNSGASTPPRSISPGKKTSATSSLPPPMDHLKTFPPSRRTVLSEIAEQASPEGREIFTRTEPSLDFLLKEPLPITQSYDFRNDDPKYTPTGFSTAEIKAMGDFPAYDILSGVPLPKPYENFDPVKALPRPYRPFRWTYHQTMCEFPNSMSHLRC
jgi:hypothetical protein